MKTAISIPDDVFDAAEEMAKRIGMSRSQLYATAVRDYLDAHRSRGVTARLDQVYERIDSRLDLRVAEAQTSSLDEEDW
jgi:metal-responsive CopG/Arc/MetJ family transcriptional regulator